LKAPKAKAANIRKLLDNPEMLMTAEEVLGIKQEKVVVN